MMGLVLIAGKTVISLTTKELAILATTYLAGKSIKSKRDKVKPNKL